MLNKEGLSEKEFLEKYNPSEYERPSYAVDDLLFAIEEISSNDVRKLNEKRLQVLLLKRTNHPYINTWCLPGVFIKMDESLEEASLRALKEKTDFQNIYLEQLYTFGEVNRDKRTRVISTSYLALIDKKRSRIKETFDREETKWFDIKINTISKQKDNKHNSIAITTQYQIILKNEDVILDNMIRVVERKVNKITTETIEIIKNDNVAFDHLKIIYYGIKRIRNKIEYSDIAFSLLPDKFTLAELQQVYELILNKKFTKANFQRKIGNRVKSIDEYKLGGFRPAKLYIYNK
jgi:8-oxo-dGTP diphosphatase